MFAAENIAKVAFVWRYTEGHDYKMTQEEFSGLPAEKQQSLLRIAYFSEQTGLWVAPPDEDPACYTNHSKDANTTSIYKPNFLKK